MREHFDQNQQRQVAFFLSGQLAPPLLEPMTNGRFKPALLARYGDLSSLRYDYPIILNENGPGDRAILSLTALVDETVAELPADADRDRLAKHAHRLEQKIRTDLQAQGSVDFEIIWRAAAECLSKDDPDVASSAEGLWKLFDASGRIVDVDADLPCRVVSHAWRVVQRGKAIDFKEKAERLLLKLREILVADEVGSLGGQSAERLRSGVGTAFSNTFDFNTLSRILGESRPESRLTERRRTRIQGLIQVLEQQRFYPLSDDITAFEFRFQTCSDALSAYNDRYEDAVKLLKTLAIAELEVAGDYRDEVHNVIFDAFGRSGLGSDELAKLPDYVICTNTADLHATETAEIIEILAAGRPFRILVSTDDVLERSKVGAAHTPLAFRSRQIVDTAIGLSDVFVFQAAASDLFRCREQLLWAASYDGPALFSVFSGANDFSRNVQAYLVAAAAAESRVFPALAYDPSAGDDLGARLSIAANTAVENDWAVHSFSFEDKDLQAHSVDLSFTVADLMAMDQRFARHFAVMPDVDWDEPFVSVPEALDLDLRRPSAALPVVHLVDGEGRLYRALTDEQTLNVVRRSRTVWRLLRDPVCGRTQMSVAEPEPVVSLAPAPAVQEPESEETRARTAPACDEAYIETPRCTTCNECTTINNKMFAYNENKQAYIADPDAGTYRQLVEAAESCQVSIIHPGKPRNPKEPGLEDLIKRAEAFN